MKNALLLAILFLLLSGGAFLAFWPRQETSAALDAFAQCLAERGAVMYGADWCPHCQNEKRAFGSSFRFIPYVECPDDPQRCLAAGITGYPTWIFPASPAGGPDGKRLEGEQGIEKLAQESGCIIK